MKFNLFRWRYWIIALLFLALPAIVQAQFTFTTNNGAITITGYSGQGGAVVIPDATNGFPITGIGDFAFQDGTNLLSVTIPGSVTNIGEGPFLGCSSLTNISVNATNPTYLSLNGVLIDYQNYTLIQYPNGLTNETYILPPGPPAAIVVTNIGRYAFASCANLRSVTYSGFIGSIYTIGDFAFSGCTGLTSVTVSNTLMGPFGPTAPTSIGTEAFSYCTSLTEVFFITTVTDIEQEAFAFCTNLTSVYFPGNAPPDVGNAFYGDPDAVVYYMPGSTGWSPTFGGAPTAEETPPYEFGYQVENGSITITRYSGPVGTVVIPAYINGYAVTGIGNAVFMGTSVTNVTIPDSVTTIGNEAFASCKSLTIVAIPDSVTSIGVEAFAGCASLTGVTIPDSITNIGELAFWGPNDLTNIVIPRSVSSIGAGAFTACAGLTNISVDTANPSYSSLNGVLFDKAQDTVIDYPAGLTGTYSIPNSVTIIGVQAFGGCTRLTGVIIPGSVTSIGDDAFFACSSLTSIAIPSNVTSIGQYAFSYCSSLTSVYFPGNVPPDAPEQIFIYTPNSLDPVIVYYLPGTTGWGATFGGAPTELWNPQATSFITEGNQFGFNLTGPTNLAIVVEACTNLTNPVWLPVSTNMLFASGMASFSDPQRTNFPNRYYRFSAP